MFKFLPGILLIQLVTAGLVFIGINWLHEPQLIIVLIAFAIIFAVLTTFWFGSIVSNLHNSAHTKLQAKHAKDREKILLKAERDKAKVTSKSFQQVDKASKNAHAKANFKVGAAVAVAIGAGGIMILSQLFTVGVMILIASGSGLAGYLTRARQERLTRNNQLPLLKVKQADIKQLGRKKSVPGNNSLKAPE
jgi:Flp pilus assembly protein TadB